MNYVLFYTLCATGFCGDTHVVLHGDMFDYCKSIAVATQQELAAVDPKASLRWKCLPAQGPVVERDNVLMTADEIMRNSTTAVLAYIGSGKFDGPRRDHPATITMGVPPSTVGDFTPGALDQIRAACRPAKDKGAP